MKYILAYFVYYLFAQFLPCSSSRVKIGKYIRRICARHICSFISSDSNIERRAVINKKLYLGKESGIGTRAFIQGETHIGSYVMMGPDCNIYTINHNTSDIKTPMCKQGVRPEQPVYIGNDVWIGSRVTILPGVHVGNGVIIGTGAVVSKDIPDMAVVVGNPAYIVKYRNN